jgi:hypothetical protein
MSIRISSFFVVGIPQICPVGSSFSTPRPVVYKSIRKEYAENFDTNGFINTGNDAKKIFFSTGCSKNAGLPLIFKGMTKGEICNYSFEHYDFNTQNS